MSLDVCPICDGDGHDSEFNLCRECNGSGELVGERDDNLTFRNRIRKAKAMKEDRIRIQKGRIRLDD